MNLFLDTLSPKNTLLLFNEKREILHTYFFDVRLQESTKLIEEVDLFLHTHHCDYHDLENIVVVNGPGSFTGVRTTVLLINTINFILKKNITSLNYFELFDNIYPIIKSSSKRDSFIKWDNASEIQIIENTKIPEILNKNNLKKVYGDIIFLDDIEVINTVNYEYIIQNLILETHKIITPFYCKKPNIC